MLTDQTENVTFRTFHRWNYQGRFPESDQLKRTSSLLSLAASFLILGHMSLLIVGMMFEFPSGLNSTQVNPVLQQLQKCVRERVIFWHITSAEGSSWAQHGPQESVLSKGHFIDADMASLCQTLKDRDRGCRGPSDGDILPTSNQMGSVFRGESAGMAGVMKHNLRRILTSYTQFGQMAYWGFSVEKGQFPQKDLEVIYSVWEKFSNILRKCPISFKCEALWKLCEPDISFYCNMLL